ncbi:acyl-CoA dehydrogenase family protein [Actinoallomurus purpureus]|uniref:acyl-CoA dehydrogenase family protein n=1 Tax=Actinoallomurus purpureus TaxID=478114 RepID=UPI0020920B38|nr:acyl-CoA dehydrogenase family protein [Actinoallomurus purpureus]MCO6007931.1 acyl-CoA dehydrogenase family protein [Actinoallomurus purpureus]
MTNRKTLDRVRDLVPNIRQRAENAERQRRVLEQTIRELTEAGVFRMLQPRRFGGDESSPVEFFEVVRAIAADDAGPARRLSDRRWAEPAQRAARR